MRFQAEKSISVLDISICSRVIGSIFSKANICIHDFKKANARFKNFDCFISTVCANLNPRQEINNNRKQRHSNKRKKSYHISESYTRVSSIKSIDLNETCHVYNFSLYNFAFLYYYCCCSLDNQQERTKQSIYLYSLMPISNIILLDLSLCLFASHFLRQFITNNSFNRFIFIL